MIDSHVIVVGGGPVGLSAAILLDRAGIRCTVVEKDDRPSDHPKARGIRTRTMEIFAQWGLGDSLRRQALPAEANRFIYCDSLAGAEIARSPEADGAESGLSPTSVCRVAQDTVHVTLLADVAKRSRVQVMAGVAVVSIHETSTGVEVGLADGSAVTGDYVIAADGVQSTIRTLLGIELTGPPVLGYGQSIYWRGDLDAWAGDRPCVQFVMGDRTGSRASIASVDGRHRWVSMVMRGPGPRPVPPTVDEAREIVRTAVGADIEPEILDIATWRISAQVADAWRAGRVFLAGDAAHSFPPTGGFGMNTGVQDVHNLVWKLALVLGGRAGDALLDTYEQERKPVAQSNADWSVANGSRMREISQAIAADDRMALDRLLEDQRAHVHGTGQDLGFGYTAGAIVPDPDNGSSPLATASVGHRFPEIGLQVDARTTSSVLHLKDTFSIVTVDVDAWSRPVADAAEALSVPIRLVAVPADSADVLRGRAAVLVRPDGFVAWAAPPGDGSARSLVTVLKEILR